GRVGDWSAACRARGQIVPGWVAWGVGQGGRPRDGGVGRRFPHSRRRRPGRFAIAALRRPPAEGEDERVWLERAREAESFGPFGLHTHWTAPDHARPTGGDPAALVRAQGQWLRSHGLEARPFCGGGGGLA